MKKLSATLLILSIFAAYFSWVKFVGSGYLGVKSVALMAGILCLVVLPFFLFIYSRAYPKLGYFVAMVFMAGAIYFYSISSNQNFDPMPLLFIILLINSVLCVIGALTKTLTRHSSGTR